MNNEKKKQDYLNVLRKINSENEISQRGLAKVLGFSLGKLNYCLRALKNKGYVKIKNFRQNPNKLNYVYILPLYYNLYLYISAHSNHYIFQKLIHS